MAPSESEAPWIHNRNQQRIPYSITIDSSSPGNALDGASRLSARRRTIWEGAKTGRDGANLRRSRTLRHDPGRAYCRPPTDGGTALRRPVRKDVIPVRGRRMATPIAADFDNGPIMPSIARRDV